jgi:hypothetical protein
MEEQTRHFRLEDRVYTELKVRAAKKGVKVGAVIKELVFPKK